MSDTMSHTHLTAEAIAKADQLTAHQMEIERLFSKNQLMPRIRAEFQDCQEPNFVEGMIRCDIPIPFGIDLLAQMALHKRANLPTMVGLLFHHLDNAQATADMLLKCAEANLVEWHCPLRQFIVMWNLDAETQEELDRFQYPLPMVIEPREITTNKQSGYLLNNSSVILRDNHHDDDVCLDHLNRLNKIRLTINLDVVRLIKNKWRNLDRPKAGEAREKYEMRVRAFKKYKHDREGRDGLPHDAQQRLPHDPQVR